MHFTSPTHNFTEMTKFKCHLHENGTPVQFSLKSTPKSLNKFAKSFKHDDIHRLCIHSSNIIR